MEPVTRRDPRDLDLEGRSKRLLAHMVGTDGDDVLTVGDLIRREGDDPATVARSILRTDHGRAGLANLLNRTRLDGEACPDPQALADQILAAANDPRAGGLGERGGMALILVPGAVAGMALAAGLDPVLAVLVVGIGWFAGWRLLRGTGRPGPDEG